MTAMYQNYHGQRQRRQISFLLGENFIVTSIMSGVAECDKKVCREGETNQSCGNTAPATPPPWLRGQKMIYEDIAICLVAASWSVSSFWLAISYLLLALPII